MSLVEAMQLGLVPVTTAVGEISNYAIDDYNAILIDDASIKDTVDRLRCAIDDPCYYEMIRHNALNTWLDKPLYHESLTKSILNLCQ